MTGRRCQQRSPLAACRRAQTCFEDLLERYPDSRLAGNAGSFARQPSLVP